MAIKLPNSGIKKSSTSAPKARVPHPRKSARLRGFSAFWGGQHCPPHCPPQPGPFLREPGPILAPPGSGPALGEPLNIRAVAWLIGCSPWTVRQTLIPRGLPHFRFRASGRLTFYRDQVIRWIENQQQGGNKTS
jgi:hypothetical protein